MNRLAIDTSTDRATLALEVKNNIFTAEQYGVKQHASELLPMIQQLMTKAELTFNELDEIVFGCGPGSFTGVRVACSVAKALSFAHNIPLRAVNSLYNMAMSIDVNAADVILVLLDAKMHELYWSVYESDAMLPIVVSAACEINVASHGVIVVVGCGFTEYLSDLNAQLQKRIISTHEIYPDAAIMLKYASKFAHVTAEHASPLYIRNNIIQGSKA